MKKFFLLLSFGLSAGASYAQTPIKAGTVALGGGIGYGRFESERQISSGNATITDESFEFSPNISYFIADNLTLGLSTTFASQKSVAIPTSIGNTTGATTSLRVGPFVQLYKMLTDQFGFTGNLGAGYQREYQPGRNSIGPGIPATTGQGFYAAITPGVIYLPIPRLGLGATIGGLGYTRLNAVTEATIFSPSQTTIASTFGANFGLAQLIFSGTYFFGR